MAPLTADGKTVDMGLFRESVVRQMERGVFSQGIYGQNGHTGRWDMPGELLVELNKAVRLLTPRDGPIPISPEYQKRPYRHFYMRVKDRRPLRFRDKETHIYVQPPPVEYHEHGISKCRIDNWWWRQAARLLATHSREWRHYLRFCCEKMTFFWIDGFFVGFDPRDGTILPWVSWETQREAFRGMDEAIWKGEHYGIEKLSRDEGGTFLAAGVFAKHWMFRENVSFGVLAQSERKVDDGTTDSVMGKIKHILMAQPYATITPDNPAIDHWMIGYGWIGDNNSGQLIKNSIRYPLPDGGYDPGCTISGYPTTQSAMVSLRKTAMLIDEAAVIDEEADEGQSVQDITSYSRASTPCIIYVSTHRGATTYFAQLCADANFKKTRLHWTNNPTKNSGSYCRLWVRDKGFIRDLAKDYMDQQLLMNMRSHPDGGPLPKDYWIKWWNRHAKEYRRATESERCKPWSLWYCDEIVKNIRTEADAAVARTEYDGIPGSEGRSGFDSEKLELLLAARLVEKEPARARIKLEEFEGDYKASLVEGWGPVQVWDKPKRGRSYLISADTAEGVGLDSSVADVWDITEYPFAQAAQFVDNLTPPRAFAESIYGLHLLYNDAFCIPEWNGPGAQTVGFLLHFGMSRLYHRQVLDQTTGRVDATRIGFHTHTGTRDIVIGGARDSFNEDSVVIRSVQSLKEIRAFQYKQKASQPNRGKWQAAHGSHDDCVMTLGLLTPGLKQLTGGYFAPIGIVERISEEEEMIRSLARVEKSNAANCAVTGY